MNLPKNGRREWNKPTQNMLFNKVLGENEKCVFHFYLKNQRNFLVNPIVNQWLFGSIQI